MRKNKSGLLKSFCAALLIVGSISTIAVILNNTDNHSINNMMKDNIHMSKTTPKILTLHRKI
ncbi:MAG: hypothetical protein LBV22_03785 [Mycoplasmataceae bacterium]|nr:hypothetical protein [Mycoplasmataceae bacterium]